MFYFKETLKNYETWRQGQNPPPTKPVNILYLLSFCNCCFVYLNWAAVSHCHHQLMSIHNRSTNIYLSLYLLVVLSLVRIRITMPSSGFHIWGTKPHRNKSKLLVSVFSSSFYSLWMNFSCYWWKKKCFGLILCCLSTDKLIVLKHHPDKRKAAGEQIVEGDNDYFTCITKGRWCCCWPSPTLLTFVDLDSPFCLCLNLSYRNAVWPCEEKSLRQRRPHLWQHRAFKEWRQRKLLRRVYCRFWEKCKMVFQKACAQTWNCRVFFWRSG